jgi:hypothetical protein
MTSRQSRPARRSRRARRSRSLCELADSGGSAALWRRNRRRLEVEIESALFGLSRIGLYAEPTSALAAAALTKLLEGGVIQPTETTVLVLTGSGLKTTRRIGELMDALPTL